MVRIIFWSTCCVSQHSGPRLMLWVRGEFETSSSGDRRKIEGKNSENELVMHFFVNEHDLSLSNGRTIRWSLSTSWGTVAYLTNIRKACNNRPVVLFYFLSRTRSTHSGLYDQVIHCSCLVSPSRWTSFPPTCTINAATLYVVCKVFSALAMDKYHKLTLNEFPENDLIKNLENFLFFFNIFAWIMCFFFLFPK